MIVAEEFLNNCHVRLAIFIREPDCKTVDEITVAADYSMEAQRQINLLIFKEKVEHNSRTSRDSTPGSKTQVRCFLCDKAGHKASACRTRPKQPYCMVCRKQGHDAQSCRRKNPGDREVSACCMHLSRPLVEVWPDVASVDVGYRPARFSVTMPLQAGELFGQPVSVLRDTGTNSIVVRRDLVPEAALTGDSATLLLADDSSLKVPEAEVLISSPYFTGKSIARCLETPLYDVIIGNVPGAKVPFSINGTGPP
ncbi:hypothetical protein V5799_013687 [Amblyomma americanum]|uniref:CCHC-type domain-containing protein n=1 Tax=Amblyomma americanum TaxID=6943 RepID=A0AAQ4E560_AMBAM